VCYGLLCLGAPSNWFQRALNDVCNSVLSTKRHSKLDPLTLLALGGAASVLLTQLLIDLE